MDSSKNVKTHISNRSADPIAPDGGFGLRLGIGVAGNYPYIRYKSISTFRSIIDIAADIITMKDRYCLSIWAVPIIPDWNDTSHQKTARPLSPVRRKKNMFITIYSHISTKYKLVIGKISACHGISVAKIIFQDAAQARYLPNMISTNQNCSVQNMRLKQSAYSYQCERILIVFTKMQHNRVHCMLYPLMFRNASSKHRNKDMLRVSYNIAHAIRLRYYRYIIFEICVVRQQCQKCDWTINMYAKAPRKRTIPTITSSVFIIWCRILT